MSEHPRDELLADFLDDALPAMEAEGVGAHLAACERCRAELALAGSGKALLADLPAALTPPVEIAATVEERLGEAGSGIGTRGARPRTATAAPRWYRAAAAAAVAAAIGLVAIVVIPNLNGGTDDRATAPRAGAVGGAASQAAEASGGGVTGAATGAVEKSATDYDMASLSALARSEALAWRESSRSAVTAPAADAAFAPSTPAGCVASGAGSDLPKDAALIRLIAARFQGQPAYIGVFVIDLGGSDEGLVVWTIARDGCRFLSFAQQTLGPASP